MCTTSPEGDALQLSYDARGNVTERRAVAKPGSGLPDIVTSAAYPASCSNPVTCNKPVSTTDARGNTTNYSYDPTHGGLLTVTAPAVPNGTRPQTRYAYTLTHGEYQLTGVAACKELASCANTYDEIRMTFAHDANGNVTSSATRDNAGYIIAASTMAYDSKGDLLSVDGPLAGAEDIVRFRYNAAREQIGTISPDPDGAGPLKHRARRTLIDARGVATKVETGTVNSQSDADWAAFNALEAAEVDYDENLRPVAQKLVSGGTTYALTQTSYDALGRPECAAQRMNPGAFGSLPSSACSLGAEGSFGPDRIVKSVYDAAGQVTQVRTAVATPDEAAEVSATYTGNGEVQTLTDGENNRTTYEYDGHDRLSKTFYPVPAKGAGMSSTSDYEQSNYDGNGNVIAFRNRAGETVSYAYDRLNRLTRKAVPNGTPSVGYEYNLLGWMTNGGGTVYYYDNSGRKTAERNDYGTWTWQYDLAGRRTDFTHPDGFNISYEPLVSFEGPNLEEMRYLHADERGSIIAKSYGWVYAVGRYDEYGRTQSFVGRFGYAGMPYETVSDLYYARERMYNQRLPRFMQPDPSGYGDGMNMYNRTKGDPVNYTDPTGLEQRCITFRGKGSSGVDADGFPFVQAGQLETVCFGSGGGGGSGGGEQGGGGGGNSSKPAAPTPHSRKEKESTRNKAKRCFSAQLGLGELASAGAAVSGFNILETRGKPARAIPGTSPASRGASAVFGQTRLPFRAPTLIGNPLTLSMAVRRTSSLARIVGRGIPVVGWGLLAYDAAKIAQCVASDD